VIWRHTVNDQYNCTHGQTTASEGRRRGVSRDVRSTADGPPQAISSTDRLAATIEDKGQPLGPLERTCDEKGLIMKSHDNPRRFQLLASPRHNQPGGIAVTFSSCRWIVRSSIRSVRLPRTEHHRAQATQFCGMGEQIHQRISSQRVFSGSSYDPHITSCCQYWGGRRYGPAGQAFRMA
jgi:hypothetical protein